MSYGNEALFADASEVLPLARAADFFHAYPRIKLGPSVPLNEFSLVNTSYLTNIKFLALPYLLTAVILVLVAVFFNVWRYFRRGLSPGADDTKDSDPGKRDGTAKAYLLFSAFLHICVLLLIAMASGANVTVHSAVRSAHLSIIKLRDDVEVNIFNPSQFFREWGERVREAREGSSVQVISAKNIFFVTANHLDVAQEKSRNILDNLDVLDSYLTSTSTGM
eukprot:IDg19910t1